MRSAAKSQNRDIGLRERLVQQLVEGSLECLICLENVRPKHAVFDCQECYQVFHIHCIKKWSKTAKNEGKTINMMDARKTSLLWCALPSYSDIEQRNRSLPRRRREQLGLPRLPKAFADDAACHAVPLLLPQDQGAGVESARHSPLVRI